MRVVRLMRSDTGRECYILLAALEGIGLALARLPSNVDVDLVILEMDEGQYRDLGGLLTMWD